jgi:hypothetical protein
VRQKDDGNVKGFQGAMKTFDASRPIVAASAIGVARAAVELTKEKLAEAGITIRYDAPPHEMTAIERANPRVQLGRIAIRTKGPGAKMPGPLYFGLSSCQGLRGSATVKSPLSFIESSVPLMVSLPCTNSSPPSSDLPVTVPRHVRTSDGLVIPEKRTL